MKLSAFSFITYPPPPVKDAEVSACGQFSRNKVLVCGLSGFEAGIPAGRY
jgi:hypothetical protein